MKSFEIGSEALCPPPGGASLISGKHNHRHHRFVGRVHETAKDFRRGRARDLPLPFEAGVGESPEANVCITGNRSYRNLGEGLLFRDSLGAKVYDTKFFGNCAGIFLLDTTGFGGTTPMNNRVSDNRLKRNVPVDIFSDGSGSGNIFSENQCSTSTPGGLCS